MGARRSSALDAPSGEAYILSTLKVSTFINAHKMLVAPSVVAMMAIYGNGSVEAFVYLALHGTYTVLWLLKHALFRDRSFEARVPFAVGVLFVFLPLQGYLIAPYLLISRHVTHPPFVLALAISLYTFGIFLHFVSDAQKHFVLRERPGLIMDGLFRRTRNPNYLGELFIYLSYAVLAWHWLPLAVLAGWGTSFAVRMRRKDRSLARHPGFQDYRRATGLLLPMPFVARDEKQVDEVPV